MPTINLDKKVKKVVSKKYDNDNHRWVYNTKTWKDLRLDYIRMHPLCEDCLLELRITSAREVHHIIPISTDDTYEGKRMLGFDIDNLRSLCEEHHKKIHRKK